MHASVAVLAVFIGLQVSASAVNAQSAKGAVVLAPGGMKHQLPESMQFSVKSDVLRTNSTVTEMLLKNGIDDNAQSRSMFYRMNPNMKGLDAIVAGTKVSLIGPDDQTLNTFRRDNLKLSFNQTDALKELSQRTLTDAIVNQKMASALPSKAFATPGDKAILLAAMLKIEEAAISLDRKASTIDGNDYALLADHVEYANLKGKLVTSTAQSGQSVTSNMVQALESASGYLGVLTKSQNPRRKVTVILQDKAGKPVKDMTVYALPGPFFDDPDVYESSRILARLHRHSFMQPTSPTTSEVDSIDARLWVGPLRSYEAMVKLVKEKKLKGKYSVDPTPEIGANQK